MVKALERYYTFDEYLALEAEAEFKNEYYDGQICPVEPPALNTLCITTNTFGLLHQALKESDFTAYLCRLRVKVPKTGFVSYPDVVISGPDEQFEHSCLVNPVAVIEVVSEATRQYKQGLKFSHYRTLESLRNCVFIWDSSPQFLAFERTSTMWWHMVDANEAIPIPALGVSLPLSEVYRGITLPPPRPEVVGEEADIINGNNPS